MIDAAALTYSIDRNILKYPLFGTHARTSLALNLQFCLQIILNILHSIDAS